MMSSFGDVFHWQLFHVLSISKLQWGLFDFHTESCKQSFKQFALLEDTSFSSLLLQSLCLVPSPHPHIHTLPFTFDFTRIASLESCPLYWCSPQHQAVCLWTAATRISYVYGGKPHSYPAHFDCSRAQNATRILRDWISPSLITPLKHRHLLTLFKAPLAI